MFCPRCSAQNSDDTKFCRACGTNLATVSLALSDPQQLSAAALEKVTGISLDKCRDGISKLIHGTGWIGASALIGIALGLFSNTNDWIFVWLGLASWMAVLGIIQWSQGISKLLEARYLSQKVALTSANSTATTHQLRRQAPAALTEASLTNKLAQTSSVTEHTTESLNHERSR